MTTTLTFPADFVWGVATSSYQIEGAVDVDGRGESIWDRFAATPGNIDDGTNGSIACDHYHRYPGDIQIMQELGLNAYRFSIAWPRILPTGRGAVNQAGLDFYSRLVDSLLEVGITPYPTLYHWDLPQALEDAGGWPERSITDAFVEYADVMTRHLGDRVKSWTTFNEPAVSSWVGYWHGRHAPGRTDVQAAAAAAHHIMLSHGMAVPVIRQNVPDSKVGIVIDIIPYYSASDSGVDRIATQVEDGRQNRFFINPLIGQAYPSEVIEHDELDASFVQDGDLAITSRPLDYVGINYYRRYIIRDENAADNRPQTVFYGDNFTVMDWEVRAQGLIEALEMVDQAGIAPEIYITENGAAYPDTVTTDENGNRMVDDPKRLNYYKTHLIASHQAIEAGIPLKGYFAWSMMDNFEWGRGYGPRFGIVRVDYDTQERLIKRSGRFYQSVIANGIHLDP